MPINLAEYVSYSYVSTEKNRIKKIIFCPFMALNVSKKDRMTIFGEL